MRGDVSNKEGCLVEKCVDYQVGGVVKKDSVSSIFCRQQGIVENISNQDYYAMCLYMRTLFRSEAVKEVG